MPLLATKLLTLYAVVVVVATALFTTATQALDLHKRADCSRYYHKINLAGNIKYWHFEALPGAAGSAWDKKICEGGSYGYLHTTPKVEGNFIARLNLACSGNGGTGYVQSGYIEFGFVSLGRSIAKVYGNVTGKFDGNALDTNVGYTATCI